MTANSQTLTKNLENDYPLQARENSSNGEHHRRFLMLEQ